MEEKLEIDLAELLSIANRKMRPDYWPDIQAAEEFASAWPATFLAIVEAVRTDVGDSKLTRDA